MRTLRFKILFFLLCVGGIQLSAWSAGRRMNYEYSVERGSDKVNLIEGAFDNTIERSKTNITLSMDDLFDWVSIVVAFKAENPDYSNVIIRSYQGNETTLNKIRRARTEYFSTQTMTIAKGPWSITLGHDANISNVAYSRSGLSAGFKYAFYNASTVFTFGYSKMGVERPESWYTPYVGSDPQLRPIHIHTRSYKGGLEQVLTERIKVQLLGSFQEETEERPSHFKVGGKVGVALGDKYFAKIGYMYSREDHTQKLKNERGYFTGNLIDSELTYEPILDMLISLSYDVIWEDEEFTRTGSIRRVGLDQYGIGFKYQWTEAFASSFRAAYIDTNRTADALNVLGGVEWTF